jgi:hypothetical protein
VLPFTVAASCMQLGAMPMAQASDGVEHQGEA